MAKVKLRIKHNRFFHDVLAIVYKRCEFPIPEGMTSLDDITAYFQDLLDRDASIADPYSLQQHRHKVIRGSYIDTPHKIIVTVDL